MSDLQIRWDVEASRADLVAVDGDLAIGRDLETAVIVSLFTDRRAEPDDPLPDGGGDRRGYWGDGLTDQPLGSRLWLLAREKATRQTLLRAVEYAKEALAWLVADGVAERVEVAAEWQGSPPSRLALAATIYRPATAPARFRFAAVWQDLGA